MCEESIQYQRVRKEMIERKFNYIEYISNDCDEWYPSNSSLSYLYQLKNRLTSAAFLLEKKIKKRSFSIFFTDVVTGLFIYHLSRNYKNKLN